MITLLWHLQMQNRQVKSFLRCLYINCFVSIAKKIASYYTTFWYVCRSSAHHLQVTLKSRSSAMSGLPSFPTSIFPSLSLSFCIHAMFLSLRPTPSHNTTNQIPQLRLLDHPNTVEVIIPLQTMPRTIIFLRPAHPRRFTQEFILRYPLSEHAAGAEAFSGAAGGIDLLYLRRLRSKLGGKGEEYI